MRPSLALEIYQKLLAPASSSATATRATSYNQLRERRTTRRFMCKPLRWHSYASLSSSRKTPALPPLQPTVKQRTRSSLLLFCGMRRKTDPQLALCQLCYVDRKLPSRPQANLIFGRLLNLAQDHEPRQWQVGPPPPPLSARTPLRDRSLMPQSTWVVCCTRREKANAITRKHASLTD